jgi:hypothetical protein
MDSFEGHNISGSLTLPLTRNFGAQVDALYSRIADESFYSGAGHFFFRNPDLGLLGVTGGYLYRDGVQTFQVGAESEYYLGDFSLGCFVGLGQINYNFPVPYIDTIPTRFIGRISLDYYPLPDLRVGVGYTRAFADNLTRGELEYQTPIASLALTA